MADLANETFISYMSSNPITGTFHNRLLKEGIRTAPQTNLVACCVLADLSDYLLAVSSVAACHLTFKNKRRFIPLAKPEQISCAYYASYRKEDAANISHLTDWLKARTINCRN